MMSLAFITIKTFKSRFLLVAVQFSVLMVKIHSISHASQMTSAKTREET